MNAQLYNEHNAQYVYAKDQLGMAPLDAREFADHMMVGTGFERRDWVGQHGDLHDAAAEARMEMFLGYDDRVGEPLPDVPDYMLTDFYEDLDLFAAEQAWYGDEASA